MHLHALMQLINGRLSTRDELLQLIQADLGRPVLPGRLPLILAAFTRPAAAGDDEERNIDLAAMLRYGFDDFLTDSVSHRFHAGEIVLVSSRDKGLSTVVTTDYRGPVTVVGTASMSQRKMSTKTFLYTDQRGVVVSGDGGDWLTVEFQDGETDEFRVRNLRLPEDKQSLGKHHLSLGLSLFCISRSQIPRPSSPQPQASFVPSAQEITAAGSFTPSWQSATVASTHLSWS
jgi:hypothetical protein